MTATEKPAPRHSNAALRLTIDAVVLAFVMAVAAIMISSPDKPGYQIAFGLAVMAGVSRLWSRLAMTTSR